MVTDNGDECRYMYRTDTAILDDLPAVASSSRGYSISELSSYGTSVWVYDTVHDGVVSS